MTEPIESGELYQHKWLYTFLPKHKDGTRASESLYLLAYCGVCNTGLSSVIRTKEMLGAILTPDMGVPRFGCINPLAGL